MPEVIQSKEDAKLYRVWPGSRSPADVADTRACFTWSARKGSGYEPCCANHCDRGVLVSAGPAARRLPRCDSPRSPRSRPSRPGWPGTASHARESRGRDWPRVRADACTTWPAVPSAGACAACRGQFRSAAVHATARPWPPASGIAGNCAVLLGPVRAEHRQMVSAAGTGRRDRAPVTCPIAAPGVLRHHQPAVATCRVRAGAKPACRSRSPALPGGDNRALECVRFPRNLVRLD